MIHSHTTHQHRLALLICLATLCARCSQAEVALQFDTNRVNQLNVVSEADGVLAMHTLGEDPFILLAPFDRNTVAAEDIVLGFEYFCPDGIDGLDVYFGPPIHAENVLSAGSPSKAEGWQPFSVNLRDVSHGRWTHDFNQLRIDWGRKPGRTVRVRNLVLRAPNETERRSQEERDRVRARKQANANGVIDYLSAQVPLKIESVAVDQERIRVTGSLNKEIDGELFLLEVQPWQELWKDDVSVAQSTKGSSGRESAPNRPNADFSSSNSEKSQSRLTPAAAVFPKGGRFSISVARFDGNRDRITSRWGIIFKGGDGSTKLVSHYIYPTDLRLACIHPDLDRKTTDGVKGMGGVWANDILDELVELGVKHITDNMWISTHFSGEERSGWMEFQHNGRDWWANPAFVKQHDRLIQFATDNGMIVSAIILVGFGDKGFAGTLQHPDADRAGQYAMPNLTTPEGVAAYEAAMFFIAKRYAQPGDPHGRISNWIMHNEVDYGWVWTNMGEQPLPVFLDTYIRSMRIVHNIARQFNPHARTFISLTHHWQKENDPAWKTYAPRAMLEMLAEFSRVEGDFEWGVAYHPYPQSLFKADAWNDTRVTDDFDTPLITPKNIAVLDRWMQRDEMLFVEKVGTVAPRRPSAKPITPNNPSQSAANDTPDGAHGVTVPTIRKIVRGVLLSEQGFHTNDYSEKSERLQGAAFLYMWQQMRGLETIESFQNHRWVDHPHEGGLKLGIRTLPREGKPYGEKKYGWEVYQALDTEDETMFVKELGELIGDTR